MTKRFIISNSIDIVEFKTADVWGYAKHKHNFFELTFIIEGTGKHNYNESEVAYNKGDVFFLTPKDEHEFVIETPSKFGILKFTEQLFIEKNNAVSNEKLINSIAVIIFNADNLSKKITTFNEDKNQLFLLYQLIKVELEKPKLQSRNVVLELFGALILLISRNITSNLEETSLDVVSEKEKIENILTYIRLHILEKERVSIKVIANQFNMSKNYVSIFMKKHTGIAIKDYIIKTKLKMAERLLKESSLNISEIALKTGFVEVSHFSKIFKKYVGESPSQFQKQKNPLKN